MADLLTVRPSFNCLLLQADGNNGDGSMEACCDWLSNQSGLSARLFAACICGGYSTVSSDKALQVGGFASIALAPVAELSARQAAPFFIKFFIELDLHCKDSINAMMAQFAFAKAQKFAPGRMRIKY
jgi:hypothetical protein